ncbi:MAG: hypothetical protein G01um10148_569 [Parcubacteria group bacterium Gr01-1014_8]|nr:MAG: hypothetical protein G01um10148_569 [Parcubacteria group bacterium Gr01-1014_8]
MARPSVERGSTERSNANVRPKRKSRNKISHVILPLPENGHHPHLLRGPTVMTVLAVVSVLQIGFFAYQFTFLSSSVNIASVLPGAIALLSNTARAEADSLPLEISPVLAGAAQKKAEDMAQKGYFAHKEPNGDMPWHWFTEAGYNYVYAGENLAVNFSDTKQLVDAWLASPAHRDNILKPQYTEIGIGMATGTYKGKEAIFVVQFFGAEQDSRYAVSNTDTVEDVAKIDAATSSVLGEQVSNASSAGSLLDNVRISPRTYAIRTLMSLIALFAALLAFSLMPAFRAHPRAVMNGFLVITVLVFFYAFQDGFFGRTVLSDEAQAATVASVL